MSSRIPVPAKSTRLGLILSPQSEVKRLEEKVDVLTQELSNVKRWALKVGPTVACNERHLTNMDELLRTIHETLE